MKRVRLACLVLVILVACGRVSPLPSPAPQTAWDAVPLAPTLQFAESIAAGDVVLLVVDAHTGAPLRNAVVSFDSTSRISSADSLGHIRFHRVSPGPQRLLVRCPGYNLRHESIIVPSAAGLALLIQMRRAPERVGEFGEPPLPKLASAATPALAQSNTMWGAYRKNMDSVLANAGIPALSASTPMPS